MAQARSQDRRVAVASLVIAMLLAGCGASTASLGPGAEPGRLDLEPDWQERQLTPGSIERTRTELEPRVGRWINLFAPFSTDQVHSLWALRYDDSGLGGSLLVSPLPDDWAWADDRLDEYGQAMVEFWKRPPGIYDVAAGSIEHPAGAAIVVESRYDSVAYGVRLRAWLREYTVQHESHGYRVLAICLEPAGDCLADVDQMIQTLRITS